MSQKIHKRRFSLKIIRSIVALVLSAGLALSFCVPSFAAQPRVDFIDVSSHNSAHGLPLSFYQTIKADGVNGVVVKVSEGTTYLNPNASVDIANASQAGLVVSAYHFFWGSDAASAKSEADFFDKQLKYVGFDKLKDGIVVADVEVRTADKDPQTDAVNAFITEMHQLGYPTVDVYSGSYFYNNNLDPVLLSVKDPWLASYVNNPQSGHPTAKFPYKWGSWQWASDYQFIGISGYFDVSEDYAGKYSKSYMAPNATDPGVVKPIKSVSLIDYMKTHGLGSSWADQVKLATEYGITGYVGSAAQNLALLSKLQNGIKPAPKPVAPSQPAQTSTYTVKSGDTLSGIGARFGIAYQTIMSLNGLRSWLIYPGQQLKLTASQAVVPASGTYTVRPGDSLSTIAAAHGTSVQALASLNGLHNVNLIYPGQALKLSATQSVTVSSYTVRSGDTLWAIAQAKHTTVAHLQSVNHLNLSLIYPGQKLSY